MTNQQTDAKQVILRVAAGVVLGMMAAAAFGLLWVVFGILGAVSPVLPIVGICLIVGCGYLGWRYP